MACETTKAVATLAVATYEPTGEEFVVQEGECLLDAALGAGVRLDHGCRVGACGACAHRITEGLENVLPPDPIEADSIRRYCFERGVRLACRAGIRGSVRLAPAD